MVARLLGPLVSRRDQPGPQRRSAVHRGEKKKEVFVPGREKPLPIDGDTPGLRILQAVRDESHRFATTRHKLKRGKRVSLSLLEGVPGIGRARSRKLLEAFGSMEAVLEATPEEIAAKAGMPKETAARLLVRLAERYAKSEPAKA